MAVVSCLPIRDLPLADMARMLIGSCIVGRGAWGAPGASEGFDEHDAEVASLLGYCP